MSTRRERLAQFVIKTSKSKELISPPSPRVLLKDVDANLGFSNTTRVLNKCYPQEPLSPVTSHANNLLLKNELLKEELEEITSSPVYQNKKKQFDYEMENLTIQELAKGVAKIGTNQNDNELLAKPNSGSFEPISPRDEEEGNGDELTPLVNGLLIKLENVKKLVEEISSRDDIDNKEMLLFRTSNRILELEKFVREGSGNDTPVPRKTIKQALELESSPSACIKRYDGIPKDWIVFVNVYSGGKAGPAMLSEILHYLPSTQVFNLIEDKGPDRGLQQWKENFSTYKILICGGDGTVGWVLNGIEHIIADNFPRPLVGIVPLGTGNDLSRAFGWGSSYTGKSFKQILAEMEVATCVQMDRWNVECTPTHSPLTPEELIPNDISFTMNNYFSVGVDAEVVLHFHNLRQRKQVLFKSVFLNKGWYAGVSAKVVCQNTPSLKNCIELTVDGERVKFSKRIKGIVVMNLLTYGGTNCWNTSSKIDDKYSPPRIDDGKMEIVGIRSIAHLGAITMGVGSAVKIAQGSHVVVENKIALAAHVDGEPWSLIPATTSITFLSKATIMRNSLQPTSKTELKHQRKSFSKKSQKIDQYAKKGPDTQQ